MTGVTKYTCTKMTKLYGHMCLTKDLTEKKTQRTEIRTKGNKAFYLSFLIFENSKIWKLSKSILYFAIFFSNYTLISILLLS